MSGIAIMQPTYLPWLGYFALMDQVDTFVFLDDVAFDRRSWQQRNRIKGPNGEVLLTVPVQKASRGTPICEIEINFDHDFPDNHLKAIEFNYQSTPFFEAYWAQFSTLLSKAPNGLSDLNVTLATWFADTLKIETQFVRSSALDVVGSKDIYLAELCEHFGKDQYLSPVGSKGYLDESTAFAEHGIEIQYLEFTHPTYPQRYGRFIDHLSAIDAVFNVGGDKTLELVRKGYVDS